MALNQTELSNALDQLTLQQGKIAQEQSERFDEQVVAINELTEALNAAGTVSQAVETSLANLQAATQSLDDAIPDAPVSDQES